MKSLRLQLSRYLKDVYLKAKGEKWDTNIKSSYQMLPVVTVIGTIMSKSLHQFGISEILQGKFDWKAYKYKLQTLKKDVRD